MATTFPVRVKDRVFLPSSALGGGTAFFRALEAAKQYREMSGTAASYQTLCMCKGNGINLVIRRSGRENSLFLAAWPNTRDAHAPSCRFRKAGTQHRVHGESDVAHPEDFEEASCHFKTPANEGAPVFGQLMARRPASKRQKNSSLAEILDGIWAEAGLATEDENSPKDWFDVVNRILPATRNLFFTGGLPLENCLRIWAPAHHGNAARFNEAVNVSGDFLAIGEVYDLARFGHWLPFCHYPQDLKVHIENSKVLFAMEGFAEELQHAFRTRKRRVIGLAHVRNNGLGKSAAELVLMIVDERYVPVVVQKKRGFGGLHRKSHVRAQK